MLLTYQIINILSLNTTGYAHILNMKVHLVLASVQVNSSEIAVS